MFRYKIKIEYLGNYFHGSQVQPNCETIQKVLKQAICTLTKQNTNIILSGRTDRGVHAKGQVAHFDSDIDFKKKQFLYSINALLPKSVCVWELEKVDDKFHAQKSAIARWYRYTIINREVRSVFDSNCLWIKEDLDVERMNESLSFLCGRHDFSSFKASRTNNPAKVCFMDVCRCIQIDDFIYFDFIANRFLYKMIRNIVGTVLMIEKNSFLPSRMKEIIQKCDRNLAGPTAIPDGLVLMSVMYSNSEKEEVMKKIKWRLDSNENL